MSKEVPLQKDLFSGELVDTRSDYRKRQDRQREKPRQTELFSARETVQVGVNPRPWLKALPPPSLTLEIQDVRTAEEVERDWWREVQKQIVPMFDVPDETNGHASDDEQPAEAPEVENEVVEDAPNRWQIGFRANARRRSIPVRARR